MEQQGAEIYSLMIKSGEEKKKKTPDSNLGHSEAIDVLQQFERVI